MANTITMTEGAGLTTWTTSLELDLYAGAPVDDESWQKGQGTTAYPGSLGPFTADNSGGTDSLVGGMKLLCGDAAITDYKAAAITLQVTGGAKSIVAFMIGSAGIGDHSTTGLGGGVRGALSDTGSTGLNNTLTLTFPGGVSDTATADVQIWMICA